MANNLSNNAWHIDTASANPVKATGTGPFATAGTQAFVSAIEFNGYAAGTDHAIVTQTGSDGNTINVCSLFGNATFQPVSTHFAKPVLIRNLAVPTLTAGYVTVYLE